MKKNVFKVALFVIVFALVVLGVCSCGKDDVESLYKPTDIQYDGKTLVWNEVALADYYTVSVNGGEAIRTNTNAYAFESTGVAFDVTVSSVVGDSEYSETRHFTPLGKIETLVVADDGTISWSGVSGATGYRISINGEILPVDSVNTVYSPEPGTTAFSVRPVVTGDTSYYSEWSETIQLNVLLAPTNIKYNGESISWVGTAGTYEIYINGELYEISNSNKINYASSNEDFTVEVKAVGNHTSSYDSEASLAQFNYLQPVREIVVSDGILSWNTIAGAEGYEIKIDGVVQSQRLTEPRFDRLASGVSRAIEVRPYNNSGNYFSSWSFAKNVFILETPKASWSSSVVPGVNGEATSNFNWQPISGASGYVVKLVDTSGNESETVLPVTDSSHPTAFAYAFSLPGKYTIAVKTLAAENSDYYDSKFSQEMVVERLVAPKAVGAGYITSDPKNLAAGFTINYTGVNGAIGYQLYKEGDLVEGMFAPATELTMNVNNVVDSNVMQQTELTYSLRAVSKGVQTVSGKTTVYLPDLEGLSFKITVQRAPESLAVTGSTVSWNAVSGANGYTLFDSGVNGINTSAANIDISTINPGLHILSVCTNGDGGTVLASNLSDSINVERLYAPTGLQFNYSSGEGVLEFSKITHAQSYLVFVGAKNAINTNVNYLNDLTKELPAGESTFIKVVAHAGVFTSDTIPENDVAEKPVTTLIGTTYYMSSPASVSQEFVKLAPPSFSDAPFASHNELVWNSPISNNSDKFTPTYQVIYGTSIETGDVRNVVGTSYNISHLDAGEHTFTVRAIGNGTKYLNSEISDSVSITKLESPTLDYDMAGGRYTWNAVPLATSYVLNIGGKRANTDDHTFAGDKFTFKPTFAAEGTYVVELYAMGDGIRTINSQSFVVSQIVEVAKAPEISVEYSDTNVNGEGSIIVNITKPSNGTIHYEYVIGSTVVSSSLTYSKPVAINGEYDVEVYSVGEIFDDEHIYYIRSLSSGVNRIILLGTPTLGSFYMSDGIIKWGNVNYNVGYDYQISLDGGEYGEITHISGASVSVSDYRSYRKIKIRVCASGNGDDIISSDWVEWTWNNNN